MDHPRDLIRHRALVHSSPLLEAAPCPHHFPPRGLRRSCTLARAREASMTARTAKTLHLCGLAAVARVPLGRQSAAWGTLDKMQHGEHGRPRAYSPSQQRCPSAAHSGKAQQHASWPPARASGGGSLPKSTTREPAQCSSRVHQNDGVGHLHGCAAPCGDPRVCQLCEEVHSQAAVPGFGTKPN